MFQRLAVVECSPPNFSEPFWEQDLLQQETVLKCSRRDDLDRTVDANVSHARWNRDGRPVEEEPCGTGIHRVAPHIGHGANKRGCARLLRNAVVYLGMDRSVIVVSSPKLTSALTRVHTATVEAKEAASHMVG